MEKNFTTYSPNDPNLIQTLTDKGVSISASPIDEKMPSCWVFCSLGFLCFY